MAEREESPKAVVAALASGHDVGVLDNPIWNSLTTEHSALALGDGQARRFPPEIGPLSGLADQSAGAYEALRALTGAGGATAQFLAEPRPIPAGWSLIRGGLMTQMVWSGEIIPMEMPGGGAVLRQLTLDDVPAMVELAHLTEPGPFGVRTWELGEFFGVFEAGRLLSMAGQRLRPPGFIEVSAVCTHPEARGRGFARAAMLRVMADILDAGATPFLHAFADNPAVRVYEALRFVHRRSLHLAALRPE